jgi:hypothetical protein
VGIRPCGFNSLLRHCCNKPVKDRFFVSGDQPEGKFAHPVKRVPEEGRIFGNILKCHPVNGARFVPRTISIKLLALYESLE